MSVSAQSVEKLPNFILNALNISFLSTPYIYTTLVRTFFDPENIILLK